MALEAEVTVSVVFGIFMAIVALIALWQVAFYAARAVRSYVQKADFDGAQQSRSDHFELEA
ncbi:uncharacterized protein Z518_06788 [Rhinocladiella mackenziei CBS 650.93]|uniref:Rhinocladiella mackenziei CBS 650.93 unplaced genomic scaffold supercont1.5, whole genome shotgun sequence n=1 Tax=Rhinocladiella mackenziei CBS 650.93 TaxID=1442369 RepID=A0A0D2IIX0_9EURO|nr:uncharacterized protein Z518_06788 [Rhinocladiella mackenziei CBS 650.93]KIX03236.1 hypothetical protein Z518_06788 [Rhinocladiella mackenziei CBS 650.93]